MPDMKTGHNRIEYRIKPSACVEGYYVHKCERHLLYSGISGKQRYIFGLEKPAGSGSIVAARAGDEWEKEVISRYIDKESLHQKTEEKDGEISRLKFDEDETLAKLKKIADEVKRDRKRRYLYQGCLVATDAFRKKHFRFDESLYDGQDEGLFIDLTRTYPDLLRADWDSEKEGVVFSVIDIKLSRRMKLAHKVQVGLYVRLLADTIDEYNKNMPEGSRIEAAVNRREGFLWNGGQAVERPFPLKDVDGLIDDYFEDVIPQFVGKLHEGIKNRTAGELRNELDRCVGAKCEWCENSTQCLREMKDGSMMQVIPYLSAYAQEFAKEVNAPSDIVQFRDFVSGEENRRLLSSNRTWEYILSDGTTIDVQAQASPFDRDSIRNTPYRWKNVRSMTMPRWQDVTVIMTAQKYAGSGRVYALGIYVREYTGHSEIQPDDAQTEQKWKTREEIFVAKDSSDGEYLRIINEFADALFGILLSYHERNLSGGDVSKMKTLQGYVMDSYELKNIEEVLYEILETGADDEIREKTMYILFWMQGEKLVEAGDEEPAQVVDYPLIVISNELKKLVALPLPVAYRLPDIIPAMNIGIRKDMYFNGDDYRDFFEIISDVMKSDVIYRVWTEKKPELLEDIKRHISKRFYAQQNLVTRLQAEGGSTGHLVRRISPFYLPGRKGFSKELLKKWYFENRLEDLLSYHSIRSARLSGLDHALETGTILRMKIADVYDKPRDYNGRTYYDRYVRLETGSLPEGFAGEWFSAVLVKEADIEELYEFDDFRNRGMLPERFNTKTTAVLGFIGYERGRNSLTMKGKLLVKYGRYAISKDDVGGFAYVTERSDGSINSGKLEEQLCLIEEGKGDFLLDPLSLEGRIKDDLSEVKDDLKRFSSPDGLDFTPSQERAFWHLYENRLTVLQGPPGTGKSDFIARAVITLCFYYKKMRDRNLRVLVCANSHPAIENVLSMIDRKLGGDPGIKLFKFERFSGGSGSMGHIQAAGESVFEAEDNKNCPVVLGATTWGCFRLKSVVFDLIIIDEASQVRVMDAMLPLCRSGIGRTRFLLVGDGDQLPAIIQGRYGIDSGTRSDYGSVFDFYRTKIRDNDLMLCENFRMNEVLLRYSAEKIYGEDYTSFNEAVAKRRFKYSRSLQAEEWVSYILDGFSNEEKDYWPLVFCRISGGTPYDQNSAEVMAVTKLVEAFRLSSGCDDEEMFWRGSEEKDGILGLVSPHHRHIERLKDSISEAAGMERDSLFIGTVDKLQGQQREAVIVSYGVTDLESAVTEGEFIFNRNRLNVALTRAKCKSITIFSEILTKPSPEMLDTDDEDLQHGIEFVCGFHDFMKKSEADTGTESRVFALQSGDGGEVVLEVYKKRMKT